jgi:lipopolysaccharide transport system permease protein
MVLAGLLSWQLFASAFGDMATSLVTNANMVTKVYFPKMLVPLSVVAVALLDLAIALVILAGLMAWYGYMPDWRIFALPVFTLFAIIAVAGPGLLIAAVTVKYRDFRYVAPFIVQVGLFASPVGFQSALIPDQYRLVYALNPMVGVIDGFRWSLLRGDGGLFLPGLAVSAAVSLIILLAAVKFFRRTEANFADVI